MSDRRLLIIGVGGSLLGAVARRWSSLGASLIIAVPTGDLATDTPRDVVDLGDELVASGTRCVVGTFAPRSPDTLASLILNSDLGEPDVLVTLPIPVDPISVAEMLDHQWTDTVDRNLNSCFCAVRVLLPRMQRGSRIVAVVGREARRGVPYATHSAAAHWAVLGLVKSAALEAAAGGIAVNAICIGPIAGESWERDSVKRHLFLEADHAGKSSDGQTVESTLASMHPTGEPFVPLGAVMDGIEFLVSRPELSMTGSVIDISQGRAALNTA